jgi:hypothetical protein
MTEPPVKTEATPCRVVVIDNKDLEASALIRALSERDIPVLYYSGKLAELPKEPLIGIRIVFLDMKLEGMEGQPDETVASSLMGILKEIISSANGPYLIFAWTKHDNLLKAFEKNLSTRGPDVPGPSFLANMEKSQCMTGVELDYSKVSEKLAEVLSGMPILRFLTKWEKIVADSRSEVISLICSMVNEVDLAQWTENISGILFQIAKAHSGTAVEEDPTMVDRSAMEALSSILKDCIEKRVGQVSDKLLQVPANKNVSEDVKAAINTRINLKDLEHVDATIAPGDLYILHADLAQLREYVGYLPEQIDSFKKDCFNPITGLDQVKLCMVEVTPICDYACGKWKSARLVPGFTLPPAVKGQIKPHAEFLYTTPLLCLEGNLCHIVLDFHYMAPVEFSKLGKLKPRYQIRSDLLSDIQSDLSAHASRRGVVKLE